jgi:glyceraldehyde-3-phosphate dehydrogenase (NADP+)
MFPANVSHGAAAARAPLGMLIGGEWSLRPPLIEVRNGFDGELAGVVSAATAADAGQAVARAVEALAEDFPPDARCEVLTRAAARVESQAAEYARDIAAEGSETIREARRDAPRAAAILRLAAAESRDMTGHALPAGSRAGYTLRVPLGVVAAMVPWPDPLAAASLAVAPALAAGNAVVLKLSLAAPLAAMRLARDLIEAGVPAGRLSALTGPGEDVEMALAADPRVRMLWFAGAPDEGQRLARAAGAKAVALHVAANAPFLVLAAADLETAAGGVCALAFSHGRRNRPGLQRVLIQRDLYAAFAGLLRERVAALKPGPSDDETSDVGPMMSEAQATRVADWIAGARECGAVIVAGGGRRGALVEPTVLARVPTEWLAHRDEVFGPVVALQPFDSLDSAICQANQVPHAAHSTVFTRDLHEAFHAVGRLQAAAVTVNDAGGDPIEPGPFGALRVGGSSRAAMRAAVREFTAMRAACFYY